MGERGLLSLVLINYLHVYALFVGRRLASRCGAHHPVSIAAVFLSAIQCILLSDSCELGSLLFFLLNHMYMLTLDLVMQPLHNNICNTKELSILYKMCFCFTFFLLKRLCVIP